jgi:GNAT superfamily N-acetyltransferase
VFGARHVYNARTTMPDLLAKLYDLPTLSPGEDTPRVRRAMAYERSAVVRYVEESWNARWASETEIAFSGQPIRCLIAIDGGRIYGFACYDSTFRGFFGPMGVSPENQAAGTGRRLLVSALSAMREAGYAYAIIGAVGEALGFYEKAVGATVIAGSSPGPYEYDLKPAPAIGSARVEETR